MSESERKQVVGTLAAVVEKPSGWYEFQIAVPGKNYPVKLSTKREEIVAVARSVGSEIATWTYNESNGNPNPHKPGEFYKNRYLEEVEPGATAEAQTASDASFSTAGGKDGVDWDAKERRDYRSRAWAQTLGAFNHTIKVEEDPKAVFERLRPFQRLVYEDVCQSFSYPLDESDIPF